MLFKQYKWVHKKLLRYYCKSLKPNKYKDTVILPRTNFPQRLIGKKVSEQNKHVYENANFEGLYSWQRSTNATEFILHDGPPYANGKLHMGHTINKILKDIINRHEMLNGKKVHYVPGWDCHGLPIELKILKNVKRNSNPIVIREAARRLASDTVEQQKTTFKSWGVTADWNGSYCTYTVPYIQNELRQFYRLYEKKLVYRDYKPVYWSPSSRTALAEAELEYNEKHSSPSIILKMAISKRPEILKPYDFPINALIWTTTPWTIPSNQAICFNPGLSYSLIRADHDAYIVATDLIKEVSAIMNKQFDTLLSFSGEMLGYAKYTHPLSKEELPFLPGSHATSTKGTGLVHIAPAHGPDDFLLALNNKIPVKCMVDEDGKYTEEAGVFSGLRVLSEGNDKVIELLKDDVLNVSQYIHSYPYDWRTKKPVIIRASQQWFIDTNALKERAVSSLKDVKIVPERNENYKQNLINQVTKRPYWCISRQKCWGVPIPVFYHKNNTLISKESIDHICGLLDKNGPDFWWNLPMSSLLSPDLKNGIDIDSVEKGGDIFDIWFDSGVSWSYVLRNRIADMYLEGVDQFNGWFQSSLITSVALRDQPPYRTIFVHGFAVDENGLKMSKSLGNVVSPEELIGGGKKQEALGVDAVRWWVACHSVIDSTAFVSQNVLNTSREEVQKVRNTLRFAIAALDSYAIQPNDYKSLKAIDRYLLHILHEFDRQSRQFYDNYQFNKLCVHVINFLTNPVSSLYYSIVKDRLYCDRMDDPNRRAVQYVLTHLLDIVCGVIAPIVPHLVEEIYLYRTDKKVESFFKTGRSSTNTDWYRPEIEQAVELALTIRKSINKQYRNTLELKAVINAAGDVYKKLNIFDGSDQLDLLQVAECVVNVDERLQTGTYDVNVTKSSNALCDRCRKYNSPSTNELCRRCTTVLNKIKTVNI